MTSQTFQEQVALAQVETFLSDIHRESRRADTKLVIPLPTLPPHAMELESKSMRLSITVASTDGWSETSHRALALYVERVDRDLRGARALLHDGAARFDVDLTQDPTEKELTEALAALDAAAHFHLREARALEDETLARIYLSTQNHERRTDS